MEHAVKIIFFTATARANAGALEDKTIRRESDIVPSRLARRKELPLPFKDKDKIILSRHDTGAEENFMEETLSKGLSLEILKKKQDRAPFSMGNGRLVRAVGRMKAFCNFAKEPGKQMECWFYVLKRLASPMIMGEPFLRETETMTKNRHRLQESHGDLDTARGLLCRYNNGSSTVSGAEYFSILGRGCQFYISLVQRPAA